MPRRAGYEGIAVCAPATVPYTRYSIRSGHWFCGRALAGLLAQSGLDKADVDGFCISSFTLAPDTAVGIASQFLHLRVPRPGERVRVGPAEPRTLPFQEDDPDQDRVQNGFGPRIERVKERDGPLDIPT